jgi:hypothetical protein
MDSTKLVAIIVVAVIVVGVGLFLKGRMNKSKLPPGVRDKMVEKVDADNGEVISRSIADWDKLGKKNGKYKNPNTGNYSMVTGHLCASCGQRIPDVEMPDHPEWNPDPNTKPDFRERDRLMQQYNMEVEQVKRDAICPKCGDPAYNLGVGMAR